MRIQERQKLDQLYERVDALEAGETLDADVLDSVLLILKGMDERLEAVTAELEAIKNG